MALVVARERGVLVRGLVVGEDLEDPTRLGVLLLRGEPPQTQLRVAWTALGHEAAQDARNRRAPVNPRRWAPNGECR